MVQATDGEKTANLGRAITRLGLEDRFLQNGELQHFGFKQRVALANQIISEKLALGRWPSVVRMIWGGFGKADVLYEGDRDSLKGEILSAAGKPLRKGEFIGDMDEIKGAFEALHKEKESDFIFNLATANPNSSYELLVGMWSYIPKSYFVGEEGAQRERTLSRMAGERALEIRKYGTAFSHFTDSGDEERIDGIFDEVISSKGKSSFHEEELGDSPSGFLITIAKSNPEKKESRLTRILHGFFSKDISMRVENALKIMDERGFTISPEDRQRLYERAATELSSWTIESEFKDNHELSLLWAIKHAKSDPITSYHIFRSQKYAGEELGTAVLSGLGLKGEWKEGELVGRLTARYVEPEHLRLVYDQAPFETQVEISSTLKDRNQLSRLSTIAKQNGDLKKAYNLWVSAGNGFDSSYMDNLRQQLIRKSIDEGLVEESSRDFDFHFLHILDKRGHYQAFDTLMESRASAEKKSPVILKTAHELAVKHDSEGRIDRVRREMVDLSPKWAMRTFMGTHYIYGGSGEGKETEMYDPAGFDYALGVLAEREGVEKDQLRNIVTKYRHTS